MTQHIISHIFNSKALIRVAFALLSLGGIAHAESASVPDAKSGGATHRAPVVQGNDYNYMQGGGG